MVLELVTILCCRGLHLSKTVHHVTTEIFIRYKKFVRLRCHSVCHKWVNRHICLHITSFVYISEIKVWLDTTSSGISSLSAIIV